MRKSVSIFLFFFLYLQHSVTSNHRAMKAYWFTTVSPLRVSTFLKMQREVFSTRICSLEDWIMVNKEFVVCRRGNSTKPVVFPQEGETSNVIVMVTFDPTLSKSCDDPNDYITMTFDLNLSKRLWCLRGTLRHLKSRPLKNIHQAEKRISYEKTTTKHCLQQKICLEQKKGTQLKSILI